MKKQNFVKITKGHAIITIHFETLKHCHSQVWRKSTERCHFQSRTSGGQRYRAEIYIMGKSRLFWRTHTTLHKPYRAQVLGCAPPLSEPIIF